MDDNSFWKGIALVVTGLADAAKQASYSLGFGAGGLGVVLMTLSRLGFGGVELTLVGMSVFFITARIGKALDERLERAALIAKAENDLMLQRKNERKNYRFDPYSFAEFAYILRRHIFSKFQYELIEEDSKPERSRIWRRMEQEIFELIDKFKNF